MSKKYPGARKPVHGLYAKNFPRSVKWGVDQDYLEKLSPEEKAWLAKFNDEYYGAKFARDTDWTQEEKRVAYRRKNVANKDYYAKCPPELISEWGPNHAGAVSPDRAPDYSTTPGYLESAEYKAARENYRANLNPGRREIEPTDSTELADAWLRLEATKLGEDE